MSENLQLLIEEAHRRTVAALDHQAKLLVRAEVRIALEELSKVQQAPPVDPYWQGRQDGTELFAAKERELVAAQEALAEVRGLLQEEQAKVRELKAGAIDCWHCRDVLEPGPFHCEKCPPFNQCYDSECKEEGCQGLKCPKCGARSSSEVDDLGHCKTCERFVG